ncbi:MAG: ATP-binding cassette domain-containing protein [Acidimicrobiales bacterium]|jgi:branched-chain amino acid transport system ATP-binding protein
MGVPAERPRTVPSLEARGLYAGYHGLPVIHGIDLEVHAGEIVGILGANGAGKTTTLLALAGSLPTGKGEVRIAGSRTSSPLHVRARSGLSFVTEDRSVFMQLSVRDNLRLARVKPDEALELFPELERLMNRRVGLLSGGEQQMLTLGRALARRPRILLGDELSHGLAPLLVRRLLDAVRTSADRRGIAVLLVEQHIKQLARVADRIYVMQRGRIAQSGPTSSIVGSMNQLENVYLSGATSSAAPIGGSS